MQSSPGEREIRRDETKTLARCRLRGCKENHSVTYTSIGGEETLIWLMINEWTATEIRVGQFRLQRRNRSLSIEENRVPPRVSTSSSRCFEPFRDGWKGRKENEKDPRQTRPTSLLSFGENWKWRETKLDTSCLLTMEKKTKRNCQKVNVLHN